VHGAVFVVKDKDCSNRFASLCGGLYGVCWFVEVVCVVHGALFVLKDKDCSIVGLSRLSVLYRADNGRVGRFSLFAQKKYDWSAGGAQVCWQGRALLQ